MSDRISSWQVATVTISLSPVSRLVHFRTTMSRNLPSYADLELKIGKVLGRGGYAVVHEATWGTSPVAVKTLHQLSAEGYSSIAFQREMDLLRGLHHPNVLQLLYVTSTEPYYIITELMDSD